MGISYILLSLVFKKKYLLYPTILHKQTNNLLLQVVSLSVAISLSLLPLELLSLLALISQFTRVFGVNLQTCLLDGMFFQPPELQLY